MRVMLVYYVMNEAGSAQDVHHYARVARELGHELVVYGADHSSPFNLSQDVVSVDALVFVFEWTTLLRYGDSLDLSRLVATVPRDRRLVIDCDGAYNDAIVVDGDYNHSDSASSAQWVDICDSLSDKVCQPTLCPLRANVRPFFFHGYDPSWEMPFDFSQKTHGMVYVGHSKFRWGPMKRVLQAIEPNRERVGRLAVVGHGWKEVPSWAEPMKIEDNFYTDKEYLRLMEVEFVPEVPFDQVIPWMSRGIFSPVIYRPLFSHLRFVTCRTFETPAANTIPLFGLDCDYVADIYGERATELVLPPAGAEEKVMDMVSRPEYYAGIVRDIRRRLGERDSYVARFQQLIDILQN